MLDWSVIDGPQFKIEVTQFGHRLPFIYIPTPKVLINNRSALAEAPFVKEAIQILLELNCIAELSVPPEIVNALSAYIQKSSKKRLILDILICISSLTSSNVKTSLLPKRFSSRAIICLLLI